MVYNKNVLSEQMKIVQGALSEGMKELNKQTDLLGDNATDEVKSELESKLKEMNSVYEQASEKVNEANRKMKYR